MPFPSLRKLFAGLVGVGLLAIACSATSRGAEIRIGLELEVQPSWLGRVIKDVNQPQAKARWQRFVNLLGARQAAGTPLRELQDKLCACTTKAAWDEWRYEQMMDVFGARWFPDPSGIRGSSAARMHRKLAQTRLPFRDRRQLWGFLAAYQSVFDHKEDERLDALTGEAARIATDFRAGLLNLKGDADRVYRIHRDGDVLEFTGAPARDADAAFAWTASLLERFGMPADALPGHTLNPHYHLSTEAFAAPDDPELSAITLELRILTALFTIQFTERGENVRDPKPFFGNENSANLAWDAETGLLVSTRKGNVRALRQAAGLREEFRSLGYVSWARNREFVGQVAAIFAGAESAPDLRRGVRGAIAALSEQVEPRLMRAAIANSYWHRRTVQTPIQAFLESAAALIADARREAGLSAASPAWKKLRATMVGGPGDEADIDDLCPRALVKRVYF